MLQRTATVCESLIGDRCSKAGLHPIIKKVRKMQISQNIRYQMIDVCLLSALFGLAAFNQIGGDTPSAGVPIRQEPVDEKANQPVQDSVPSHPLEIKKDSMVRVEHDSRNYWGRPLAWDGKRLALVGLDGQLKFVPVDTRQDIQLTPDRFQPYAAKTMRRRLTKEFGNRYEVTTTENFVVVHPNGDSEIWAPPFEALYARFRYYFEKHQFALKDPEFPLVAVVLRSRNEFDRYMNQHAKYNRNVMGIYQVNTNRMVTYDPKAKLRTAKKDKKWLFKYKTVIHELAHQAAFNTGVHNRFSPPARWAGEGLAMMFETDGINNSKVVKQFGRRVNRSRLKELKKYYANRKIDGKLTQLITDDRMFQTEPFVANSLAWGLTFYLSETFPRRYFDYLKNDSQRKDFETYSASQRLADFANAFGSDIDQIDRDLRSFILRL
jgi:hypothetical protein